METDTASSRRQAALPIRTSRLTIRPLCPGDIEAMHAVYSDAEVTRYIPGWGS